MCFFLFGGFFWCCVVCLREVGGGSLRGVGKRRGVGRQREDGGGRRREDGGGRGRYCQWPLLLSVAGVSSLTPS